MALNRGKNVSRGQSSALATVLAGFLAAGCFGPPARFATGADAGPDETVETLIELAAVARDVTDAGAEEYTGGFGELRDLAREQRRRGRPAATLAREWLLSEALAQPMPPLTWTAADRRYCAKTGCVMTGPLTGFQYLTQGGTNTNTFLGPVSVNYTAGPSVIVAGASQVEYSCTGSGFCNLNSASNQGLDLDCGGGTCTAQLGATNATTSTVGRNAAMLSCVNASGTCAVTGSLTGSSNISATTFLSSGGATSATVQAQAATLGRIEADTTNNVTRIANGTSWDNVLEQNPDGGGPYGNESVFTGYNGVTTASNRSVTVARVKGNLRVLDLGFIPTTVGVGAGTFTVTIKDETSATVLCTSNSISCTAGVAPTSLTGENGCSTRLATSGTGHAVTLNITCSTCTTCPLGNVVAMVETLP